MAIELGRLHQAHHHRRALAGQCAVLGGREQGVGRARAPRHITQQRRLRVDDVLAGGGEAVGGVAPGLLRHRVNFGAGWSARHYGFGLDGHYFHSRVLPAYEWVAQGAREIPAQWQFDAYVQTDLARWLPWNNDRYGLRAQLRVNNFLDAKPARYAADTSGVGVQPYGDWRGPVYSLSLTATF